MAFGSNVDLNIIARFNDQITQPMNRVQSRMQTFAQKAKANWLAITAGIAGALVVLSQFKRGITAVISAAQEQEDAVNKLNTQLEISGVYTAELSERMQRYARELQRTTRFGDEAVIKQQAFAMAMGASAEQAFEIVRVAADMSASLNIDLNASVRNITKTLGGYSGELGEVIPELKNLTTEQLRAGEGVDLLSRKFKGAATRDVETYSGRVAQLKNAWSDLLEQLGFVIISGDLAADTLQDLNEQVRALSTGVTGLSSLFDKIGGSKVGQAFKQAFGVTFGAYQTQLVAMSKIINQVTEETEDFGTTAEESTKKVESRVEELMGKIKEGFAAAQTEYDSLGASMVTRTKTVVNDMESAFGNFFYNTLTGQVADAKSMFASFGDYVLRMMSQVMAQTLMFGTSGKGGLAGALTSGISNFGGLGSLAGGAMKFLGFNTGTEYVPRTGMYQLHRGEKIVSEQNVNKESSSAAPVIVNFSLMSAADVHRHSKTITDVVAAAVARNGNVRGVLKRSL